MKKFKCAIVISIVLLFLSASSVVALNVYVTDSGNATNMALITTALTNAGHSVTQGLPWYALDGAQGLSSYNTVVLLDSYNWGSNSMPGQGQTEILNYVTNGGGLVTGEWFVWSLGSNGYFDLLDPLSPVATTTTFNHDSTVTYNESVSDPVLNLGVAPSFSFSADNVDGTQSLFSPKSGATVYYTSGYGDGLIGWDYSSGKVISFSTVIGNSEMGNSNYRNLFVNSVEWAAGDVTAPIPEPATMLLLATGLLGLAGVRRRFKE